MAKITVREAISQALWEEMEADPKVFIMGEEVGVWGGTYAVTKGFYDHFGAKRVKDTPIAEAAIIGGAIGAALTALRPVAELMTINFAFSAMDHIVNEAAKLHYMFGGQFVLPLVIRAVGGGGRQLGATSAGITSRKLTTNQVATAITVGTIQSFAVVTVCSLRTKRYGVALR
jgi:pyruvate dehydrogenase E1 component beta subunit